MVGADTVVVCDGRILEKPKSPEAAVQMISDLSGRCVRRESFFRDPWLK